MSEGFRDCFVGEKGYDEIKKSMKLGNEFCNELAKCLQDRNDAEVAYARALRKTATNLEKLVGKAKGTLAQALVTLVTQTNKEADAHSLIADQLLNEISIPMRNLADAQAKERKSIEDSLNLRLKDWNSQKDVDNKYRSRQFNQCREIESLAVKISEASSGSKSSSRSKTSSVNSPLVLGCVLPASRYSSVSEKLEGTMKKAEEELERIEDKYHSATRNVEVFRQNFDAELCRRCDQLQKMETDRLTELANYVRTYATSTQTFTQTMNQITQDLSAIQIIPENDILVQVRSYNQPSEIEVLLYDIYAENEDNVMNEQRRVLNLMNWIARLKKDIEVQQQTKNASQSSLRSSAPVDNDSPDDDRGSSSDGAMCPKKDVVRRPIRENNDSSPSNEDDDDDDGGMYRSKKKTKKKSEVSNGRVSSEVFIDRQGAAILEELYRASLYKIECVYNRIKKLPQPQYQHADRLTRTYTKDGTPTTLLRLPCHPSTQTPASAPTAMRCFAESMPMYQPTPRRVVTAKKEAPPPEPGWNLPYPQTAQAQPMLGAAYPVLQAQAPPPPNNHVKALYEYTAKRKDELNLRPGDIILLLNRRDDDWCEGNLNGKVGLFPGNYVTQL